MVWQKLKNYADEWRYQMFYYTFYAGLMPLLLFLPVYLRHVGLSAVHVGILNGIRPILQSLVTPLLVNVGEKLRSRKLLFITSCMIAIAKVLIMYLLIRPQRQLCVVSTMNESDMSVVQVSKLVHVSLLDSDKRAQETVILNKRIGGRNSNEAAMESISTRRGLGTFSNSSSEHGILANLSGKDFIRTLIRGHQPTATEVSNTTTRPEYPQSTRNPKENPIEFDIIYNKNEIRRIFMALIFLTIVADPFIASIYILVDYSCAANPDVQRGYRETRLWETVGWGTMTPLIGLVIYELSHEMCGIMVEAFHYVFFFYIVLITTAALIGIHIDFTHKIPVKISSKIHSAHSNLQYGMFSIISAFAGFGHGFLLTFTYWFIDSLGGTTVIMGVATGAKSIVDLILYFLLGNLIEKLGYVHTVSFGLVGHIVVFLMFYGITNPWLVILVEIMYAVVYGSLMSSCASFLVNVAPAGSSDRMQAIFHGIYWGVGTSIGCVLSGYRLSTVGFPYTFLTFAGITTVMTFIFLAIQIHMFLKVGGNLHDQTVGSSLYEEGSEPEDWDTSELRKLDDHEDAFR